MVTIEHDREADDGDRWGEFADDRWT